MRSFFTKLILGLSLGVGLPSVVSALPKIHAKGKYLFDESGNRFYIKGVSYQEAGQLSDDSSGNDANGGYPEPSTYVDPLSIGTACDRDLPYLQALSINAVRIYSVNASVNHDECMSKFSAAGIYTIIDLSLPLNGSINRASPSWTSNLLDQYIGIIDAFAKYDNVLSYNVGNEVVNLANNTATAPFIKAAARDVKAYLKSKGSSALVGYSSADGSAFRDNLMQYLTCDKAETSVDIYGLNSYRWCGNDTYSTSGYASLTASFQNLAVPSYLSEFGCNKEPPRLFTEVASIFSQPMSDVFSGGVAFSYFAAQIPGYELATLSGTNNETVTTNADYDRLKSEYAAVQPPSLSESSVTASSYATCPSPNANFTAAVNLPPTPSDTTCQCLTSQALPCVVSATTAQLPVVLGALLDYSCSLLEQGGLTTGCDAISANGATGVYGNISFCDPATKLAYVFSEYFASQKFVSTACDFAGNATINHYGGANEADIQSKTAKCFANFNPTGTPSLAGPTNTASGSGSTSTKKANSALPLTTSIAGGLVGMMVLAVTWSLSLPAF